MSSAVDRALGARLHMTRRGRGEPFVLDVELEAAPGITILFGPSGSGKSTILQCIAGLVRPESGSIRLGGERWLDVERGIEVPAHRRGVAYLFQSLALFPHLTAVGNVTYGIDRAVPRAQRQSRARALLDKVGVGHLAERRPRTFSGGEAQRVALARALAMEPRVILLDEPFSALDRTLRVQLARLVRELIDELGIPAIQVTHDHGEAAAMGDLVLRMDAGQIVERGAAVDVLGENRTPMPVLRR